MTIETSTDDKMNNKPAIWIDFENAPHVWVMSPIIEQLKKRGYQFKLTARDFSYTIHLCRHLGFEIQIAGASGFGKNNISKAFRLLSRVFHLYVMMYRKRRKISIALSHGSRSQVIAARLLNIPVISLDDYEHSNQFLVRFMNHLLVPFPISEKIWGQNSYRITQYPGLKEEIYLCKYNPNQNRINELKDIEGIKVLFRPEGRFTHYRSERSEIIQTAILDYLATVDKKMLLVILPRDELQKQELVHFCENKGIPYWLPLDVLDGPSLISEMDLVLSGGGTMTREAAVLGVPSYSFFAGKWGAVDCYLKKEQRIIQISSIDEVDRIKLKKRKKTFLPVSSEALDFVTRFIEKQI